MTPRIGLIGAGPWAAQFHAPLLAAGPDVRLAGVWARRPEAAAELADRHGAQAYGDLRDMLAEVDAVSFAVPPDVQAALVAQVAAAGLPMLLEKPLALTLDRAREVAALAVPTQLMLTSRYAPATRTFLERAAQRDVRHARMVAVWGSMRPGHPFATPWRMKYGAFLDVAPHALDLLDAAVGPIERVEVSGDPGYRVQVRTEHVGGATAEAVLSLTAAEDHFELVLDDDLRLGWPDLAEVMPVIAAEFAQVVATGRSHELDARRGLYLQELMQGRRCHWVRG
jgi:predicted dehydrogenase